MHPATSAGSDHLLDFFTDAGAAAAVLALVGGVVVAIRYSRKVNATVSAKLYRTDNGGVLAVRPSVRAFGSLTLRFKEAKIEVFSVYPTTDGNTRTDREHPRDRNAFPVDTKGNPQFVNPGETLTSTVLFRVDDGDTGILGWLITLSISSKGLIRHGMHWGDRVFVPVASSPKREEPENDREAAETPG
jgi:hypothetical protein